MGRDDLAPVIVKISTIVPPGNDALIWGRAVIEGFALADLSPCCNNIYTEL